MLMQKLVAKRLESCRGSSMESGPRDLVVSITGDALPSVA